MSKKLLGAALILGFATSIFAAGATMLATPDMVSPESWGQPAGGNVNWVNTPKEIPNGWYWMYDGQSGTSPLQPFPDPVMTALPYYIDLSVNAGNKLAPYNDQPWKYTLTDSFWYYGHWYKDGDYLYVSPDGWISFDDLGTTGFPYPPAVDPAFPVTDDPNELIAPLWQDNNPLLTADPTSNNRIWYLYRAPVFAVEWRAVKGMASGQAYNYEVALVFGGQNNLITYGTCGVVFSYHYINFTYRWVNSSTPNWNADGGKTGIENAMGDRGIQYKGTITYVAPTNYGSGQYGAWAVRSGYKKIFKHDVQSIAFLSPGPMVLRWTDIEPKVVVGNVGQETEHFNVVLDIFDEAGASVYHNVLGAYDELPNERDTVKAPCWVPGEFNSLYDKRLVVVLDRDECHVNDTLMIQSLVHCNDTFRYLWNFGDIWAVGWGILEPLHFTTSYPVDQGVLVTGGRVYIDNVTYGAGYPNFTPPLLEVWRSVNGCGLPFVGSPPVYNNYLAAVLTEGFSPTMMGWCTGEFPAPGVWVASATPGNIWGGESARGYYSGWFWAYGLMPGTWPAAHPCYTGPGPGRSAYVLYTSAYWGVYGGDNYPTYPIELFVHLGFGPFPLSPKPAPPCYYDEAHDLTAFRWEAPDKNYLEAELAFSPIIAIANIGRQKEPTSGFFPVKFIAVKSETGDTAYMDSALVTKIGWLGDLTDDPDTLLQSILPWAPEGICRPLVDGPPILEYELIGLVRCNEVGPDLSDHCPYNDTIRRNVESLWKHDVGISDLVVDPPGDGPRKLIPATTPITITATVENFGFNEEHDVQVRCEVRDHDSGDVVLYHNIQNVSFIDWRGNDMANPYTADVIFPTYTCANDHWQKVEVRTELVGDLCPDDDFMSYEFNLGIEETSAGLPYTLEVNAFSGSTNIYFATPHSANVSLKVYDISGKLVATIVDGSQTPGAHNVRWNGTDNTGRTVAQGIYLVRMDAENFSATKKLVIY